MFVLASFLFSFFFAVFLMLQTFLTATYNFYFLLRLRLNTLLFTIVLILMSFNKLQRISILNFMAEAPGRLFKMINSMLRFADSVKL